MDSYLQWFHIVIKGNVHLFPWLGIYEHWSFWLHLVSEKGKTMNRPKGKYLLIPSLALALQLAALPPNVITIDFPGALGTQALGINSGGDIVGSYQDPRTHGFALRRGTFATIDAPDARITEASGISPQGDIVGEYQDFGFSTHGFKLQNGTFSQINFPGATGTQAFGINSQGYIVGNYQDASFATHGFELRNGTFSAIDFPGAHLTEALGINPRGDVVGLYQDASYATHGFELQREISPRWTFPALTGPKPSGLILRVTSWGTIKTRVSRPTVLSCKTGPSVRLISPGLVRLKPWESTHLAKSWGCRFPMDSYFGLRRNFRCKFLRRTNRA
jgi:hypothetical protein